VSARTHDFAIVGAGVIGCAIARELARRGAGSVVVVDAGLPGGEASGAAAGVLAVASSRAPRGVVFALRRASAALFPALVEELRAETGVDPEYGGAGLIDLAFSAQDEAELALLVARRREQGFAVEWLDAAALCAAESGVHAAVRGGALWPGDVTVHPPRLVEALLASAQRRGVELALGEPVHAIEHADGRVLALFAGARRIVPGELVVAAGVGSAAIGALLRVKMPVRPDRGEMIALRPPAPLRHTLAWREGYLVPRRDGELLIGSTSARNESEKVVAEESVRHLRQRAARMMPGLADAPELRRWAGLRPMSTLRRPIIGPLRNFANVTLATGHHRSGILLAPITARLVAELLLDNAPSIPLHPFCYRPR